MSEIIYTGGINAIWLTVKIFLTSKACSAVPVSAGPFISNIKIIEMMPQMPGCRDGAAQMTRNVPEIGSVSNWALANNSPRSEDAAADALTR